MDRQEYDTQQATHAWVTAREAKTPREARQWLERAYRFAYTDDEVAFALATTRLADGDAAAARTLFASIATRRPTRDVLAGLAASALAGGDRDAAARALAQVLSTHAPSPSVLALARLCGGAPGWCALQDDGTLILEPTGAVTVTLDGIAVTQGADGKLPRSSNTAATLAVTDRGQHLRGSPFDLAARRRTEGFVTLTDTGIEGWAWQPGCPDTDPVLRIAQGRRHKTLTATDLPPASMQAIPLARPRGFRHPCDTARQLRVLGCDGRDLWGSPLGGPAPIPAAPAPRPGEGTAIVIPVYGDAAATRACIASLRATVASDDMIIVVNDASPEPSLVADMQELADRGVITLLPSCAEDSRRNLGFPSAANVGLKAAAGRDVVLLNSDTLVFPGWLAALREAAHSAPDIGTATPISNDATIFSYPTPVQAATMPTPAEGAHLARLAARVNKGIVIDVPTGHGFCLFIRADCLHRTGLFRAALFAQGYGEENDFCERARAHGFRHVAVPGVYVAHQGGASFGAAKTHLLRRNLAILEKLHPTYGDRVDAFAAADPLGRSRRRLDIARIRATYRSSTGTVLLVTHATRGGTTRVVQERAASARARGLLPLVLRGDEGVTLVGEDGAFPNLRFDLAHEAEALFALLRVLRLLEVEMHHLMGHHPALVGILDRLSLATDIWVHDYGCLCPRLTFATGDGRFCGEVRAEDCAPCLAQWEQAYTPPIDTATLRARSRAMFAAARRVVVASEDVAARIRRHFPIARIERVPWQPDPPAPSPRAARHKRADGVTVAVIGAISQAKGFDVLLDCANDAAARRLRLRFVVVGFTLDDTPLMETGHVFVTGPYQPQDAARLIASIGADIAFLPSIWPETWCYALTDAWEGGLDAAVFDIGTPAERVRRTGRGFVLPLGLPPAGVNDALLNHQILACSSA